MKNNIIHLEIVVIALITAMLASCSGMHQVSCPDFSKNRNYSSDNRSHHRALKNKKEKNDFADISFFKKHEEKEKEVVDNQKERKLDKKGEQIDAKSYSENKKTIQSHPVAENYSEVVLASNDEDVSKEIVLNQIVSDEIQANQGSVTRETKIDNRNNSTDNKVSRVSSGGGGDGFGFSIASLVLGIVAFMGGPAGLICGVLAIVFGAIALKRSFRGRGLAIAGLVLGIVACILILL